MIDIAVTAKPTKEERGAIGRGLAAYNRAALGSRPARGQRWILARDAAGTVLGGAKCALAWRWLYVDWLWVAEAQRRQGLGARLLAHAEALARELDCRGIHLHTFSFQAPGFYRKQGFTEVARVEEMMPGAAQFWFIKRFDQEETP